MRSRIVERMQVKRREFIALIGTAATGQLAARSSREADDRVPAMIRGSLSV